MGNIVGIFVIKDNLLQTLSNMIFLCTSIIFVICLFNSYSNMKRTSIAAFSQMLYVDVIAALLLLYNNNTKLLEINTRFPIYYYLIFLTIAVVIWTLLRQLFKKPIENGTAIVVDEDGNHNKIIGEAYKKYFKKTKIKNFFIMLIRDIFIILSMFLIKPLENLYDNIFYKLSNVTINGAYFANISIYTIILIGALIVVYIINWILNKFDTIWNH